MELKTVLIGAAGGLAALPFAAALFLYWAKAPVRAARKLRAQGRNVPETEQERQLAAMSVLGFLRGDATGDPNDDPELSRRHARLMEHAVNLDGTPMVQGTPLDIHGKPYGVL